MKNAFIILCTLVSAIPLHAQNTTPERVIAEVDYRNFDFGHDPMHYAYAGFRGSFFNYNSDDDGLHYVNINNAFVSVHPDF